MHNVTKAVTEDLRLDMFRVDDTFFQEHFRRTEGLGRFGNHPRECLLQLLATIAATNATPATTGGGLEHHRITDAITFLEGFVDVGNVAFSARGHRDTGLDHAATSFSLVAHTANDFSSRANELDPTFGAYVRKFSVLRQKAITGMQGITTGFHSQVHQLARVEVAGQRLSTNAMGLIGTFNVQGMAVGVGVDRHGANAHLGAGTHDPNCNFTPVGDQDFFYHWSIPKAARTNDPAPPVGA
ncbi:hypothetical protein D3C80_1300320 [compost metagenome]